MVDSALWRSEADPRALCQSILAVTIKEEDRYQIGLSKIFFRAGMLALLESLRTHRLNYLVTLVQKNVKRHFAQRDFKRQRTSAVQLQSWWRGTIARKQVLAMRQNRAATMIQKVLRGRVERQRFLQLRASVIKTQSSKLDRQQIFLELRAEMELPLKSYAAIRPELVIGRLGQRELPSCCRAACAAGEQCGGSFHLLY